MFTTLDHRLMARALRLARRGLETADPNPRVGCVIALDERVLGEGWHREAGGPHAEVEALAAAAGPVAAATWYVTLEPCCHHGRTGPCTEVVASARPARVVVAAEDPNPAVAGRGIAALREAGIPVQVGLLADQAEALNPGFAKRMRTGRPFVRCKLAASMDGRTALASGESRWITGPEARRDVQRLRARSSAVLTGVGTILSDDPRLDVREAGGDGPARQPLRVIADTGLRTPAAARVLAPPGTALVATAAPETDPRRASLAAAGAGFLHVPAGAHGGIDPAALLGALAACEANEVLLESGPTLAGALVARDLVDEVVLYLAPLLMGHTARGLLALPAPPALAACPGFVIAETRRVGQDLRVVLRPGSRGGGADPSGPRFAAPQHQA